MPDPILQLLEPLLAETEQPSQQHIGSRKSYNDDYGTIRNDYQALADISDDACRIPTPNVDSAIAQAIGVSVTSFSPSSAATGSPYFAPFDNREEVELSWKNCRFHSNRGFVWYKDNDPLQYAAASWVAHNIENYLWNDDFESLVEDAGWELEGTDHSDDISSIMRREYQHKIHGHSWRGPTTIFRTLDESKSHVACLLYREGDLDPQIHRIELLSILRLIALGMKYEGERRPIDQRARTYPVALFSISGNYGRVLHASYTKSKVSVCMSDFIHLRKNTEGNLMRYLGWMLSSPVNENEVELEEEEDELLTQSRPSTGKSDLEERRKYSSMKEAEVRMKALKIADSVKVTPVF